METKIIELITKMQAVVTSQRETLANHKSHIIALQTSQFIMLRLFLEYDDGLRNYIVNALKAAEDSAVVARDPFLKAHFQELLKLAEAPMPSASNKRPDWLSVISGGKQSS